MNSVLKKNKLDLAFWAIQFFYWGTQAVTGYFDTYYVEGYTFSTWHTSGAIVDFLTTMALIAAVRYLLKNYLSWEQFKCCDVLKVLAVIFVSALLWTPLHVETGDWVQVLFFPGQVYPEELKWHSNKLIQWLTMGIKMTVCVVSYICLKVFINANAQRLQTAQLVSSLRQAQLNNLKNQISPHFLFNNLNNIRGLMLENPAKSNEMLTKLSEVLQHALYKNQFDAISVAEELKMVDYYISLSKMQFESRLQYSQKVNATMLFYKIPPMIIQLLIENAIKHGISNVKEGGFVALNIEAYKNKLQIQVLNNGSLVAAKKSTGVGLKNITQRLKFIYGDEAVLSLEEKEENVLAQIRIPIIN